MNLPRALRPLPIVLLSLSAGTASAQEGGIEVFAAQTLFDGGTRVSLSHVYRHKSDLYSGDDEVSNPLDLEFEEHRVVLGIDHGLRADLTLSALVPWVAKELDSNVGDSDGRGLGDVTLLAKFRAHKRDWQRGIFQVSLIGGIEIPTGETDERQGGTRVPPRLQPGTGAWSPIAAVSTNVNLDRFRLDGLALYKLNTEGDQDYERGDFLALGVGATWRFLHTKYPGPTAGTRLGLLWRHEDRDEQDGASVPNTGSDQLLLQAGVVWHPLPNIDLSLEVDFPLYQDFKGVQLGLDYRTFLAAGFRF